MGTLKRSFCGAEVLCNLNWYLMKGHDRIHRISVHVHVPYQALHCPIYGQQSLMCHRSSAVAMPCSADWK